MVKVVFPTYCRGGGVNEVRRPEYCLVLMVLTMVFTELSLGFVIEFDSYLLLESKEKMLWGIL